MIAEQFGHRDGGKLNVDTYGHPDAAVARRRIRDAFAHRGNIRYLAVGRSTRQGGATIKGGSG